MGQQTNACHFLAALLRTWRERALLSQEQLAARTGLGVRTVRRLAEALELTDAERAQLAAAAQADTQAVVRVPRQLPADVAGFTGRVDHLRRLDALLAGEGGAPATVVISAIAGTAGVGKTKS